MSSINKRVFWNTGCHYTEHGQRMGAYYDGEYIHYVDVDRMCNGSVQSGYVDSEYIVKQRAMAAYDNGLGDRHIRLSYIERRAFEEETKEKAPSNKKE